MKKRIACSVLCLCCLTPFLAGAQSGETNVDSVQQKLNASFAENFKSTPHEKLFVQTNQGVYLSGQTIWYKTYATAYGKPSQLSRIAYVRLVDDKGNLVKQDKLPLDNGTGYGNMDLRGNLKSGWYTLQAFTAWMLNFDRRAIYQQSIYIQNGRGPVDLTSTVTTATQPYSIQFLPEGGKLIDGTIANVVFKATGKNGLPVPVTGDVTDGQHTQLASIQTIHDGLGSFELETYAGTKYTVHVRFPDGSVQNVLLPGVAKEGINLRVTDAGDRLQVRVINVGQKTSTQQIIAAAVQDNGQAVCYPLQISRGINIFGFNKSDFATGILWLAIFDETGKLAATRPVFINRHDGPQVSLTTDTLSFKDGAANAFTIRLKDRDGLPVKAALSVAVTDERVSAPPADITSYLPLTAELQGVYHSAYYFNGTADSLARQLDLAILTGAPIWLKWDGIFNNAHRPLQYAAEKQQVIAGQIIPYDPSENMRVKMMIADAGREMAYASPDKSGIFSVADPNMRGATDIYYAVEDAGGHRQKAGVTFFDNHIDSVRIAVDSLDRLAVDKVFLDTMITAQTGLDIINGVLLKQVDIKQVRMNLTDALLKEHVKRLTTDNAQTLDVMNTGTPPVGENILDYINGRITGLTMVKMPGDAIEFRYHGESELPKAGGFQPDRPYFFVDESLADMTTVNDIPLSDVALIRFVPPAEAWFAPENGGFIGAILIYTKTPGDDRNTYNQPGRKETAFDEVGLNGFNMPREFTANTVGNSGQKQASVYPSTLYWAHDVQTSPDGMARISFPATGKANRYRAIIQGIDDKGRPIYFAEILSAGRTSP